MTAEMRSYAVADVFCDAPLQGNPVAVFTDGDGLDGDTMQRTARELNLSETVFVLAGDTEADARVRIFTPFTELPFAGHPVLGTAFVLGSDRGLDRVHLRCDAGLVPVALQREAGAVVFGEMEQPIPTWSPFAHEAELLAALGVGRSGLPVEVYDNGPRHTYVELPGPDAVAALAPDLRALAGVDVVGVSCFAVLDGGARVKTRMFGPALGVAEDPATGSAAGPLAVHLARHGRIAFGDTIEIHQGAEVGRPSVLRAAAEGSAAAGSAAEVTRVAVGGGAIIVARGEYRLS